MLIKKHLFLLNLLICVQITLAEDNIPPFFEVNYKLYSDEKKIGLMERNFYKTEDNNYIFRSEVKATGLVSLIWKDHIVEVSNWNISGSDLVPLTYTYRRTGGKKERDVKIDFDWDRGKIINRVNDSLWYMETQPGILDKLLYQLVIMIDLKSGKNPTRYIIADGGKIKEYFFERIKDEIVETPIGNFNTIKLARYKKNNEETFLWCAYELGFLPVKVITKKKDGKLSRAIIKSIKGFKYKQKDN